MMLRATEESRGSLAFRTKNKSIRYSNHTLDAHEYILLFTPNNLLEVLVTKYFSADQSSILNFLCSQYLKYNKNQFTQT